MGDQTEKKIEEVKVGDRVESQSENGKKSISTVTDLERPVRENLCQIDFANGESLRLTSEHPVFTQEGWKAIDIKATGQEVPGLAVTELREGDKLVKADGTLVGVNSFACWSTSVQTYNLILDGEARTYFAGGFLVHNKGESATCQNMGINNASKAADGTYYLLKNNPYTIHSVFQYVNGCGTGCNWWLGYNANSIDANGNVTSACRRPFDESNRNLRGTEFGSNIVARTTLGSGMFGSDGFQTREQSWTPTQEGYYEIFCDARQGGLTFCAGMCPIDAWMSSDDAWATESLCGVNIAFNDRAIQDEQWIRAKVVGPSTCSILSISPSSLNCGGASQAVTITYNGTVSAAAAAQNIRLWLEKQDNTAITNGSVSPLVSTYTNSSGTFYSIAECNASSGGSCSKTVTINIPLGNYYFHCGVGTDPGKCSGNPFCTYEGGSRDCSGWQSCSASDNKTYTGYQAPNCSNVTGPSTIVLLLLA